jgi:hypothetical protein
MTIRPGNRTNTKSAAAFRGAAEHRTFNYLRSTKMYSMHEALARDRMRESEQRSREGRLARELAAERRWHRVSVHAKAAQARHARRVSRSQGW